MIGPLYHRLRHWADKRRARALAALRDGLPLLLIDLRETATAAELADAILARVQQGVQASRGALTIDDKMIGEFGVTADEVTVFPVRVKLTAEHSDFEGWLLVGPRSDGSCYGREEHRVLEAMAQPIARALVIALHREHAATEQQWLIHSLDVRLTRLEAMLAEKN